MNERDKISKDVKGTRDAFERADGGLEPSMKRLMEAVPDLMAEAARRRHAARPLDFLAALTALAGRAVPRLAAATAVPLVVAAVLFLMDTDHSVDPATSSEALEQLILTGSPSGDGFDNSDPLLQAIADGEDG